jgi:hypothetical protein
VLLSENKWSIITAAVCRNRFHLNDNEQLTEEILCSLAVP